MTRVAAMAMMRTTTVMRGAAVMITVELRHALHAVLHVVRTMKHAR